MRVMNLTCVHPFGQYVKGQQITDQDEVAVLLSDRDNHFVRTYAEVPDPEPEPEPAAPKHGVTKAAPEKVEAPVI